MVRAYRSTTSSGNCAHGANGKHERGKLSYSRMHGTAHGTSAKLFAEACRRDASFCIYVSVFHGFGAIFRIARFLAGAPLRGSRNAGARPRPAGQHAARELLANGADHGLANQSRDPLAA